MILTIDNLDGNGARDYTPMLLADAPLQVSRTLNQPSLANGALLVGSPVNPGASLILPVPSRRGRVIIRSDAGTLLFTGYLTTEPAPVYIGVGLAGPVYRVAFSAVSDEWLLDKQSPVLIGQGFATSSGSLLANLTERIDAGLLNTSGIASGPNVGVFAPALAKPWSTNAAALANSTCSAYRVLDRDLSLAPVGSTTHALNFDADGVGTLQVATLRSSMLKELANDITLTGEVEAAAYVTELFSGDGTTANFMLSEEPFRAATPTVLADSFHESSFSPEFWIVTDTGGNLSLGSGGLILAGGTGIEGQTTFTAIDTVELGGSIVFEAAGVQLTTPSNGILLGLYAESVAPANCFAGYNVRQSGGNTVLTPFVNGVELGTPFTVLAGHAYTLRIRTHSVETQRVLQSYYARESGEIVSFGSGFIDSPVALVFDLQDLGSSAATPATVLYDGTLPFSPSTCTFALFDSLRLTGSIGSCNITQTGSAWITGNLPGSATATRLIGAAGEGVDCKLSTAGELEFLSGHIPVAGEIITVTYRTSSRAVARLQNIASVRAEAAGGFPGTARWLGKVLEPIARSSADCEAAAQAMLSIATSRDAAIAGSYTAFNMAGSQSDIWPGDLLSIVANRQPMNVIVRKVEIKDTHSVPELLVYQIAFANEWAESLGITLSESIAPDAVLPQTALSAPVAMLPILQRLLVISANETTLQIDAGVDPPSGGGFEVRLRDDAFGTGPGQGLILRSTSRSFSIARSAQAERYYIRMFDASIPPLYSRFSNAVFTNLPTS